MTLGELLMNGGWAMVPIYLCSAIALAVFFKKIFEFRAVRLFELSWLDEVVKHLGDGELDKAREISGASAHPVGRIVQKMLETFSRRPDRVEAEAARVGSLELQGLEKHLGALSFIAQAAPLLGLLGTVLGMVELFMALQGTGMSSVDAALLSAGIWKALLTTAAGLMVAVPALAAYTYLNSRTDRFRLCIKDAVARILNNLPVEGPETKPRPKLVLEAADAI
ncbi:MAG: MotA/TolQ/ExbB proton channel family protein [Bradymonadaceae bacterium]